MSRPKGLPHPLLSFLVLSLALAFTLNLIKQSHDIRDKAAGYSLKVMVINFEPGNLRSTYGWNDPVALENQYIADARTVSGGSVNYQIVNRITVNDFPVKLDGFKYAADTFAACWANRSTCHSPDTVDYVKILNDYDVCGRANRREIDELWLWGGPYFGYWEAVMTGPNAFFTNASPISSNCQRQLHVMGFNYERGVSEMLEDLGHRVEGTLAQVFGEEPRWNNQRRTAWGQFVADCGWMHYAPNSTSDYNWSNTRTVSTSCGGTTRNLNCSEWGCDGYDYKKWWLNHLPTDWWNAIVNYDGTTATTQPSPTPTPTSTLKPQPTPTPTPRPTSTPTPTPKPTLSPADFLLPKSPSPAPSASPPPKSSNPITFFLSWLHQLWLKLTRSFSSPR